MKKTLTLVTPFGLLWVLGLAASPARAETPTRSLAIQAGPNAATQAEDNRVNRYGASGGVAGGLQWSLGPLISLAAQVELAYVPRGAEVVVDGESVGRIRHHCLDVAITARPGVQLGPARLYTLLGGGLSVLLNGSKDDAAGEGQDITDGLNRINAGLLAGAGVAYRLPGRQLGHLRLGTAFVEARYDLGLRDTDAAGGFKNRTSSIMLGVSFLVGGGAASTGPAGSMAGGTDRSASAP